MKNKCNIEAELKKNVASTKSVYLASLIKAIVTYFT